VPGYYLHLWETAVKYSIGFSLYDFLISSDYINHNNTESDELTEAMKTAEKAEES